MNNFFLHFNLPENVCVSHHVPIANGRLPRRVEEKYVPCNAVTGIWCYSEQEREKKSLTCVIQVILFWFGFLYLFKGQAHR